MEVSLTQIFDRPLRGREFFEEIIRDNLDLGRPDRVPLIFDRVVTKKTPAEFRTALPDRRNVPEPPQGFWSEQGLGQSAVRAENRQADQSALAGSRTRQPQQRL